MKLRITLPKFSSRIKQSSTVRAMIWTVVWALIFPALVQSQSLRPVAPSAGRLAECPASGPPPSGSVDHDRVAEFLRQGQQAALTGDRTSAREFLAEAARLDPAHPEAAYNLARLLEELGDTAAARREYCRFLSLPVSAVDSAEVSGRLAALRSPESQASEEIYTAMSRGMQFLERDERRAAEQAFTYAIYLDPTVAESYLNRAIAREARGRRGDAIRDYREYLSRAPDGEERQRVVTHLAAIAASLPDPASVGKRGLLIPGWGQITTGRPALGVATIAAVAGAGFASTQTRISTRTAVFLDPFDVPREYEVEERTHPYLVPAIAGGVALTLAAALEAYLHARSLREAAVSTPESHASTEPRLVPRIEVLASGERLRVGFQLKLGS